MGQGLTATTRQRKEGLYPEAQREHGPADILFSNF